MFPFSLTFRRAFSGLAAVCCAAGLGCMALAGAPADAASLVLPLTNGQTLVCSGGEGGAAPFSIVRLNADGTVDPAFAFPSLGISAVLSVRPYPDGRLLLAADFSPDGDTDGPLQLIRLNADGTQDETFQADGIYGTEISLLPDGKILLLAEGVDGSVQLERLAADGSPDASFQASGPLDAGLDYTFQVLADGSVALTGSDGMDGPDTSLVVPSSGEVVADAVSTGVAPTETGTINPPPAPGTIITAPPGGNDGGGGTINPPPGGPGGGIIFHHKPVVTITAVRPRVYSGSGEPGKFILRRRTDDLSSPLRVVFQVHGSAVAGQDYEPVRHVRIIPAGARIARITIRPVKRRFGSFPNGHARIRIAVSRRAAYRVGKAGEAWVKLIDPRTAPAQAAQKTGQP